MCQSPSPPLCRFPQGSGVGASAAELLEEAALSQGGEGSPADSADAGEGLSTSIHRIQKVTDKNQASAAYQRKICS